MRTSQSHPLYINEVVLPSGGRIGLTFCPGKKGESYTGPNWDRDMQADLDRIQDWGASTVITLLEPHEFDMLEVHDLGPSVTARGMRWLHMPIVDGAAPETTFETGWKAVRDELRQKLQAGEGVLVHCRGGLGRAGTVASLLLIDHGTSSDAAIRWVRSVRPGAIETESQERFLAAYRP